MNPSVVPAGCHLFVDALQTVYPSSYPGTYEADFTADWSTRSRRATISGRLKVTIRDELSTSWQQSIEVSGSWSGSAVGLEPNRDEEWTWSGGTFETGVGTWGWDQPSAAVEVLPYADEVYRYNMGDGWRTVTRAHVAFGHYFMKHSGAASCTSAPIRIDDEEGKQSAAAVLAADAATTAAYQRDVQAIDTTISAIMVGATGSSQAALNAGKQLAHYWFRLGQSPECITRTARTKILGAWQSLHEYLRTRIAALAAGPLVGEGGEATYTALLDLAGTWHKIQRDIALVTHQAGCGTDLEPTGNTVNALARAYIGADSLLDAAKTTRVATSFMVADLLDEIQVKAYSDAVTAFTTVKAGYRTMSGAALIAAVTKALNTDYVSQMVGSSPSGILVWLEDHPCVRTGTCASQRSRSTVASVSTLPAPVTGVRMDPAGTLTWTPAAGARAYTVLVSNGRDVGGWTVTGTAVPTRTNTNPAVPALLARPGVPLRWLVISHGAGYSVLTTSAIGRAVPTLTLTSPSAITVTKTIKVAWRVTTPAGATAKLEVRRAVKTPGGALGPYRAWWAGRSGNSVPMSGARAGYGYCFRARVTDTNAVLSGWSTVRCSTVPADDRALAAKMGWTRATARGAYKGTVTSSRSKGAVLTWATARGSSLVLLVTKTPGGGSFAVLVAGKRVAVVSTTATRLATQVQVLLRVPTRGTVLTLRVLSPGKRGVSIDGIAALP